MDDEPPGRPPAGIRQSVFILTCPRCHAQLAGRDASGMGLAFVVCPGCQARIEVRKDAGRIIVRLADVS